MEPGLPSACFVYNYPASLAALARVEQDARGQQIARRFEVYVKGLELANGYHELNDAEEQARRFAQDNDQRVRLGKPAMPADRRLIAALQAGMPACAGVAMGLERILMLAYGKPDIAEVMTFNHPLA